MSRVVSAPSVWNVAGAPAWADNNDDTPRLTRLTVGIIGEVCLCPRSKASQEKSSEAPNSGIGVSSISAYEDISPILQRQLRDEVSFVCREAVDIPC